MKKTPNENQKHIDLFTELLEQQGVGVYRTMLTELYINYTRSLLRQAEKGEGLPIGLDTQLYFLQELIRVFDPLTECSNPKAA
ncbi:hypothetical protein [Rufibacter immobilis]|uniref:hypothetical protein n=1 Tax=Rufibacter immobilis TaxID=1348778 RepID=UPI0035E4F103